MAYKVPGQDTYCSSKHDRMTPQATNSSLTTRSILQDETALNKQWQRDSTRREPHSSSKTPTTCNKNQQQQQKPCLRLRNYRLGSQPNRMCIPVGLNPDLLLAAFSDPVGPPKSPSRVSVCRMESVGGPENRDEKRCWVDGHVPVHPAVFLVAIVGPTSTFHPAHRHTTWCSWWTDWVTTKCSKQEIRITSHNNACSTRLGAETVVAQPQGWLLLLLLVFVTTGCCYWLLLLLLLLQVCAPAEPFKVQQNPAQLCRTWCRSHWPDEVIEVKPSTQIYCLDDRC